MHLSERSKELFRPVWFPQLLGVAAGTQGLDAPLLLAAKRAIAQESKRKSGDHESALQNALVENA